MTEKEKKIPKEAGEISRREFLKDAGFVVAGAAIGAGITYPLASGGKEPWLPDKWDYEADVVVVGTGFAGLSAAIEVQDAGCKTIVLEKTATPESGSILCLGAVTAGGSSLQKEVGIDFSPEDYNDRIMGMSGNKNDPELVQIYAENSGKAIDWLVSLGVEFNTPSGSSHQLAPGYYEGPAVAIPKLISVAREQGAEVLFETKAEQLVLDRANNDMVIGVEAVDKGGKTIYFKAKRAVVLATGGHGASKEILERLCPGWEESIPVCSLVATGDGLIMAQAVGARVSRDMAYNTGGGAHPKERILITGAMEMKPILVNKDGKRFVDESIDVYTVITPALVKEKDATAYSIFDSEMMETFKKTITIKIEEYIKRGMVIEANTIEDLASKLGLVASSLRNTVDTYNEALEKGQQPSPERAKGASKIAVPPFYGVELVPGIICCRGGLDVNAKAEVFNVNGNKIPRLYAAGEVGGNLFGQGYIGGSFTTQAFVFGRIAGQNAANLEPWD